MLIKDRGQWKKAEAPLKGFQIFKHLINSRDVSTDYTVIESDGRVKRSVVKRAAHKVSKRAKQFLKGVKNRVVKLVLNFTLKLANWVVGEKKIGPAYYCANCRKNFGDSCRKFAASSWASCCKCSSKGSRICSGDGWRPSWIRICLVSM